MGQIDSGGGGEKGRGRQTERTKGMTKREKQGEEERGTTFRMHYTVYHPVCPTLHYTMGTRNHDVLTYTLQIGVNNAKHRKKYLHQTL